MSSTYGDSVFQEMDAWLHPSGQQKTAGSAELPSGDPDKTTSHPVKNADGGTQSAPEGSRSSENAADVKKDVPDSVDENTESVNTSGPGGENTETNDIGTKSKATGEDSANETSSAKGKKDDPGTTHPAEAGTEKFASLRQQGSEILAQIAVLGRQHVQKQASAETGQEKKAEASCGAETKPAAPAKKAEEKPEEGQEKMAAAEKPAEEKPEGDEQVKQAAAAGREAANQALEAVAHEDGKTDRRAVIAHVIKTAAAEAIDTARYIEQFSSQQKQAAAKKPAGQVKAAMDGGMPPPDAGAVMPPPDAGAMLPPPPEAAMDPPAAPGAGGEVDPAEIDALAKALLESGIPIEELIALLSGGEGAPAGGGEAPPPEAAPPAADAGGEAAPPAEKAAGFDVGKLNKQEKVACLTAILLHERDRLSEELAKHQETK